MRRYLLILVYRARLEKKWVWNPSDAQKIRSSIMGIPVFISEAVISWVISGLDNIKTSPWNDVVNQTMFNSTIKGK